MSLQLPLNLFASERRRGGTGIGQRVKPTIGEAESKETLTGRGRNTGAAKQANKRLRAPCAGIPLGQSEREGKMKSMKRKLGMVYVRQLLSSGLQGTLGISPQKELGTSLAPGAGCEGQRGGGGRRRGRRGILFPLSIGCRSLSHWRSRAARKPIAPTGQCCAPPPAGLID